ncbi:hypothetical protein ACVWBP_24890, partial [Escherichia coli]
MDCVHHIWCPLFSQEFQDLPDGAETTLTPKALKGVYISAGSWPENGVDVDDETMAIYTGVAPQGKTLGADKNGNPA